MNFANFLRTPFLIEHLRWLHLGFFSNGRKIPGNCHGSVFELRILLIQHQKNSIDSRIFAIAYAVEILNGEKVGNSSFDITLMKDHLLVCLQLEKISLFPKTNKRVFRCRSILSFFGIYCICREAYFRDDIKSDDGILYGKQQ